MPLNPCQGRGQGRLCAYEHLVLLTVAGWPAVTDGLDGDLARLQQWLRRDDGPGRTRAARWGARLARRAARGSVPRRPPPWAFALRRAAAAWCGGFPAGA